LKIWQTNFWWPQKVYLGIFKCLAKAKKKKVCRYFQVPCRGSDLSLVEYTNSSVLSDLCKCQLGTRCQKKIKFKRENFHGLLITQLFYSWDKVHSLFPLCHKLPCQIARTLKLIPEWHVRNLSTRETFFVLLFNPPPIHY
jgi:hypothetical protein